MFIGIVSFAGNAKLQNYVRWLETCGATTLEITSPKFDMTRVQGVVWVGGSIETMAAPRTFLNTLRMTLEYAVAQNKAGICFPIWGMCLGFQLLALVQTGKLSAAKYFGTRTVQFRASSMATAAATSLKVGTFRHNYSLRPPYPSYLTATSEESDALGPYLTSFQFKKYPFYGVLWHAERPMPEGEAFSRLLGAFFLRHVKTKRVSGASR